MKSGGKKQPSVSALPAKRESSQARASGLTMLFVAALVFLNIAAYLPALDASFHETWDDNVYITSNQRVKEGLTLSNIKWAFTTLSVGFYYPLTWISHMTDVQFYGMNPRGHYATSMMIHAANAVLLYFLFFLLTGARWRSFLGAAFFSVHPMNVESVAWLAERKNVLSVFFLLLALIFYLLRYKDGGKRKNPLFFTAGYYIFFAMGLLTKSHLVVFPLLLLLLDFWPLKRFSLEDLKNRRVLVLRLLIEKAPMFLMSFVSGFLTILAQKEANSVIPLTHISFPSRIGEALMGYWFYLEKLFLPLNLCAFYPHSRGATPLIFPLLVFALLCVLTAIFARKAGDRPVLIFGWLFFVISLLPVIGILQVGSQAHADRYVYFPYWGLFLIILFGIDWQRAASKSAAFRTIPWLLSAAAIASMFFLARAQIAVWKDDETLFTNVTRVSPGSILGYFLLGTNYLSKDQPKKALEQFNKAAELENAHPDILCNLGVTYLKLGENEKALEYSDLAINAKPELATAHYNKACALINLKRCSEALESLKIAEENGMDKAKVREAASLAKASDLNRLFAEGRIHAGQKRWGKAESVIRAALEVMPDKADAWCYLGYILQNEGKLSEAEDAYLKSLSLDGSLDFALLNLGLIEAGKGDRAKAAARLAALEKMNSPSAATLKARLAQK